jgi:predicted GIY-YIG superfamily endonuclease
LSPKTITIPAKVRFLLLNGLTKESVNKAKYYIYAHKCISGTYVGMTTDPVKRLQQHFKEAFNDGSNYFNDEFKIAIRKNRWDFKHYIVAIANTEEIAKSKEASAIGFYSDKLNMRIEKTHIGRDYKFEEINEISGRAMMLEKKTTKKPQNTKSDSDRKTVIGEIYMEQGRKRVRTIEGQHYPKGMNIGCPRDDRARFNIGDKVRVNVSLSKKGNKEFLRAANTTKLILVK